MILLFFFWIFPFSLADPYPFQWNSGGLQFTCKDLGSNWLIAGQSCFLPYSDVLFNFSSASQFCQSSDLHFSVAAIVDNWLVARSLQSIVSPQLYWTGIQLNNVSSISVGPLNIFDTIYNPLWAADQPPNVWSAEKSCVALDFNSTQTQGWRLVSCSENLPILCQTFACFQDEFRCKDNSRCIPLQAVNDGFYDCQDRSDESLSGIIISRSFSQEDCRHVYLKGSGEFSAPTDQNEQSTCRWDIEATDGQVLVFTIEGSTEGLTAISNTETIPIPVTNGYSHQTTSNFITFRLKSQNSNGLRVRFYSTDPNPCQIVNGVAEYNSVTMPFDCAFQASAPVQTQFLLFMTESMSKTQTAVVNVTGAEYSFSFTGSEHSQAVVIPAADAILSITGAWKNRVTSSFRIKVIPFGSTCLVIPLSIPTLSLHWPRQPSATFVPHCLSFIRLGKSGHTWRIDNVIPSRIDSVQLKTKEAEMSLTAPCTYRERETATLGIKQLSSDFSISFKVSEDCTWESESYSLGSQILCDFDAPMEKMTCELGGTWSSSPSICLKGPSTPIPPQKCKLEKIQRGYPIDGSLDDALNFRCFPGYVVHKDANCNLTDWICTTLCIDGQWYPPIDSLCDYTAECPPPPQINGSTPNTDGILHFAFNTTVLYTIPTNKFSVISPKIVCENSPTSPYELAWVQYGFDSITENVCLSYPLPFGRFEFPTYYANQTATILCIPGYYPSVSPTCKSRVYLGPYWDYSNASCVLPEDKNCKNGSVQMIENGTSWICNCNSPYQAKGSPGNQSCELRNPCEDGTHLCDDGIECIYDTNFPLLYTCNCPVGTLWISASQNGLIANVSCISPCRIEDIPLTSNQFLSGYVDPPGDMNLTLYCKKEVISLGKEIVYIGSLPQKCSDMKKGIIDDPCKYIYPSLLEPFFEIPLASSLAIFEETTVKCEDPDLTVTGFNTLFCSTKNYTYFSPPANISCEWQSCPSLEFLPGWVKPQPMNDYQIGTDVLLANCSPRMIRCVWKDWEGNKIPAWNTTSINCTNNDDFGAIHYFPPDCTNQGVTTPYNLTSGTPYDLTSATPNTTPYNLTSATPSTTPYDLTSGTPYNLTSATPSTTPYNLTSTTPSTTPYNLTSTTPSTTPYDLTSATPSTTPYNLTSTTPSTTPYDLTSATPSTTPYDFGTPTSPSTISSFSPSTYPFTHKSSSQFQSTDLQPPTLSFSQTAIPGHTIPHIHPQIGNLAVTESSNQMALICNQPNCIYNLNSCSNGLCDYTSGSCICSDKYIFDQKLMQCVLSEDFFWCSSKGIAIAGFPPRCSCFDGYGGGGYNASQRCIDPPKNCTNNCGAVYPGSSCQFTTNLEDGEDFLRVKCIEENNKTLTVDGTGAGDCLCQNGGNCLNYFGFNTLPCNCTTAFAGERCQVNRFCEALAENNPNRTACYNGGVCNRDYGNCTCLLGWTGPFCQSLTPRTSMCSSNPCNGNGDCLETSSPPGYFCKCNPGWSGTHCDDPVDYCYFFDPCVNGVCSNKNVEVGSQCTNCSAGFTGDFCSNHTEVICSSNSYCNEDTSECRPLLYPDYICVCKDNFEPTERNWTHNAKNCDGVIDYCSFNPCTNGVCSANNSTGFSCDCTNTGFTGKYCDNDLCAGYNCSSGTCVPKEDGVICKCPPNFNGTHCENEIHNCTMGVTCFKGICVSNLEGQICNCTKGYEGEYCDQKMTCSQMNYTCFNGGTCLTIDASPGYNCTCSIGVSGKQCEILGTTCSENYCNKRGNCTVIGYTAVCSCLPGYTGETCQFDMNTSYDLLWTGYPSNQRFVSQHFNTTWFKEFTLCGWVLYAPKTAVKSTTQLPPFMGITTDKAVVLSVDNQGVIINEMRDINVPISALQWNHVCLRSPKYNSDRPTWAYFLNGNLVKNTTEMSLPQNNHTLYMVELDPNRGFQGQLSLIQLFSICLTEEDVATLAYDCVNASQNSQLNEDLLIGWKDFTRLDRNNPGVVQLQPGICDVSTCLPGRPCGSKDKISPVVISCPAYILKISSKRLTEITWDSPIFQDNIGITSVTSNFRSGQAFPWGYYKVIYTAKDQAGNTATCEFPVMVAPNNCSTQNPTGGVVNATWVEDFGKNSLMTAQVNCHDANFPKVDPAFFICDVLGQWDRISFFSPGNPYNFPSCGNTTNPTQFINGTLIANGTCNDIYNTLNNTLSGICTDPNCITIISPCNITSLRAVRKAIHDVVPEEFFYTIIANNTREVLLPLVNNSVSTAFPDSQSTVDGLAQCDENHPKYILDGNQNSCVDCAPGTWWNGSSCNDCPADTYREHGPINVCLKCEENLTTGGVTKAPSAKMCYKICEVGSFYDFSLEDCKLCPYGTYQDTRGRTECINCPLYHTTIIIGESTPDGCNKICPVGQQITSDETSNNCIDCPQGTFKNKTIGPCEACPLGRTTSRTGCTQENQCNIMNCPPNTFQNTNLTNPIPLNVPFSEFCPRCPMGTYQNLTNQTNCLPCPSEDTAPTCSLVSDCSPSRDMCSSGLKCQPLTNISFNLQIPIYSCSSTTVSPDNNTTSSTKVIIAVVISIVVVVLLIAAGIVIWIFRDKLPCAKYMKRGDGIISTDSDVYRAPRVMRNRTATSITDSSKSSVEENVIPRSPEPERPKILPPPILTSRSALDALPSRRSPLSPQPFTIPRISETMTSRNLFENDEEPVVRHDASDDEDDYFG